MNTERTTILVALVFVALIAVTPLGAYAQEQGMTITATAEQGSDTITITGKTASDLTDVTFRITSPSRSNVVDIDQVTPDANGEFQTTFKVGSKWTENGLYEIGAKQGNSALYNLKVLVEVTDGSTTQTSETDRSLPKGILGIGGPNVAIDAGLTMQADGVVGSTIVMVTGTTDRLREDITITVTTPNGNLVSARQISPDLDGTFSDVITTGGPLWSQDGFYKVTAQQNDNPLYNVEGEIDIRDGVVVPEFGAIAAMILAVAIISIIAVSARSRLNIMPKY
ncbi:MAG: PEFG-CTERM sorting domain-containing protein [Nitrosopumilus sp. B06]|nr:MAG: PEFG-CTERM sorting domain-containing protein [Nitrosopumilus sp. D6]RNJ78231.1 MAG: PEFG-CTERM sorting domain-containing protein [Nitrosopumilus sp. B06]